jgi:hypothetical protein
MLYLVVALVALAVTIVYSLEFMAPRRRPRR